jgi:ATP-dependent helicase/nuclease subunit A
MAEPQRVAATDASARTLPHDAPARVAETISARWQESLKPSHAVVAAKVISVTPSRPLPTAGEHGTEWGTVIHLLLEAAAGDAKTDLVRLARASLEQQSLDTALADKAVETVQAVMASDIWRRARASPLRLVEVPFQILRTPEPEDPDALPTILRGVIDLVFREDAGWVIVDYKTDARPKKEIHQLVDHYRGQVQTYAQVWQETTGEPIAEKGLYFTHPGVYAKV